MIVRVTWVSFLILLGLVISSCAAFEDPSKRATQNAESTMMSSTISAVDTQIETVVALQATADSAVLLEAQLTQVAGERDALQLTVSASGQVTTGITVGQPNSNVGSTPSALDGGAPAGNLPSPSPPSTQTQYINGQTASQLTADYCAAAPQTTFSTTSDVIYFVVTARNLQPNVAFSLRISQEGQIRNLDTNFWVSDGVYDNTCIYYGIDSNNIPFEAGSYTVELLADTQSIAQTNFTIN